ncbi:MAG: glycosyltransferase family 2 protein [Gemmatimonadales bacterium]|nr:glycosyltransferase family 2 protein [Gemmatimonadales bacterium]MYK02764.1 glycosyltransferase family 2 protein [Candidatus Palauibacter ramosifaciens]
MPGVSVVVPARDAEATLAAALDSVLAQDYGGAVEAIVADGSETAATRELVRRRFPGVRVVPNPRGGISAGLNLALAAARHAVVARLDARAAWPSGYLARAVATLERSGAVNVGGRQHAAGTTRFERAVALVTNTPLGAGGARYRVGGREGPVETVFLGVFRRAALEAAGGWDEALLRSEDYELNCRLRALGGTVWFDPALSVAYRPRGSLGALARQYFDYGRWKRAVLRRHPRSLRLRQAAPPLLLAALAASALLAVCGAVLAAGSFPALAPAAGPMLRAAAVFPAGYALLLAASAGALGLGRRRAEAMLAPAVAATIHLAWAAGFFAGPPAVAGRGPR